MQALALAWAMCCERREAAAGTEFMERQAGWAIVQMLLPRPAQTDSVGAMG